MTSSSVPRWISAAWISLTLLTFLTVDAVSLRAWVLAATIGIVPPLVLLRLWSDGLAPTVAEMLHAAEAER